RGEQSALGEADAIATQRVRQGGAGGLRHGAGAELHAATSARAVAPRRTATISARMATAISAGETAPIARPIGAWIRASSALVNPAASMRRRRAAWVLRLPSAPT